MISRDKIGENTLQKVKTMNKEQEKMIEIGTQHQFKKMNEKEELFNKYSI